MHDQFLESLDRILSAVCTPQVVRDIERTGAGNALWTELESSGFADALLPEGAGGAGLSLAEVEPLLSALGRHLVPIPFADTMIARAILARGGQECPKGSVLLDAGVAQDRQLVVHGAMFGRTADFALLAVDGEWQLLSLDNATITHVGTAFDTSAQISWTRPSALATFSAGDCDVRSLGGAIAAAQMAGALARVLELTLQFAGERKQFGRAIGKFQAIQQQISVMSEHVAAATMASKLAFSSDAAMPAPLLAATAKLTASEAVRIVVPAAHAIHGAIGISEEHDLQLYSRRLQLWRMAFGAESAWGAVLGAARLADRANSTVEFILQHLGKGRRPTSSSST